jgi:tRNA threonylcarbamoyladenosine biosynthesis protein TsaB
MILAIETATSACSAAVLAADGALVAQRVEDEGPAHAQRLLPFVHEVLEEARIGLGDLDAVVCGLGPGAYTGMRIGVATARALAQACGLRLAGAPTLAAVALALAPSTEPGTGAFFGAPAGVAVAADAPLIALLDGKRREVFAGVFRASPTGPASPGEAAPSAAAGDPPAREGTGAALVELAPLAVVAADDLAGFLGRWPGALVGGDGALLYADRLPETVALSADATTPTAEMVGRAWLAGVPGATEGFEAVLPVYGRAPDAARWQARRPGDGAGGAR